MNDLAAVDSALAESSPLPRSNGELVFDEPWQGRALGMGVVALDRAGISLVEFSGFLADAVARHGYDVDEPAAVLTVRDAPLGEPTTFPRERWHFARDYEGSPVPDEMKCDQPRCTRSCSSHNSRGAVSRSKKVAYGTRVLLI